MIYFIFGVIASFLIFTAITTIYAAITDSPFLSSPKRIIREAFRLAELKPGEKMYDLGCGNGRSLVIAGKEFGADATGFELSFHHYLLSKLSCFFFNKEARVFWKNFHKAYISDADVVFCFLTPKAFSKISDKFKRELRPGARIVIYSSFLTGWKPVKVLKLGAWDSELVLYVQDERLVLKRSPFLSYNDENDS